MKGEAGLRQKWEERAAQHLDDERGVLYAGLPTAINRAIAAWHAQLVTRLLLPALPRDAMVLDLAAGYGRLSHVIGQARADIRLVGMDFSLGYACLYRDAAGSAVCGDLSRLPFGPQTFDCVIAVTGLMYLNSGECERAAGEIVALLKPGGLALFLDPGAEMISLLRRFLATSAARSTGGNGFGSRAYLDMFDRFGTRIARGGNSCFTLLLPLLLLLGRWPRAVDRLAHWVVKADLRLGGWSRWALHRWVVVRREA